MVLKCFLYAHAVLHVTLIYSSLFYEFTPRAIISFPATGMTQFLLNTIMDYALDFSPQSADFKLVCQIPCNPVRGAAIVNKPNCAACLTLRSGKEISIILDNAAHRITTYPILWPINKRNHWNKQRYAARAKKTALDIYLSYHGTICVMKFMGNEIRPIVIKVWQHPYQLIAAASEIANTP